MIDVISNLSRSFSCKFDPGVIEFTGKDTQDNIDLINSYINKDFEYQSITIDGVAVSANRIKPYSGRSLSFRIEKDYLKRMNCHVHKDWSSFLKGENLSSYRENFYIVDEKTSSLDFNSEVESYRNICSLIQILLECQDHKIGPSETYISELVFLYKTRITLPINYDESSLKYTLDGISIIKSLFQEKEGTHLDHLKSITKSALHSLISNIEDDKKFEFLLSKFSHFSKTINENYQLYVSELSFDNIRKEYEEEKRDYLKKINEIFSNIQTTMLGIPISIALSSIKIEPLISKNSFYENVLISMAILCYILIASLSIRNQQHTLKAIRDEYTSRMNRLGLYHSHSYEEIQKSLTDLETRHSFQKRVLFILQALVLSLILLLVFQYFGEELWAVYKSLFGKQTTVFAQL